MAKTRLEAMQAKMEEKLGPRQGAGVAGAMEREYRALCAGAADQPKSFERHTRKNIFPAAAAFRALLAEGMEREQAAKLTETSFLELMDAPAEAIRKILKVPGLYRLMPRIWKTMMPKMFREDSGFRFRFYPTDGKRVKFDMLECPYHQTCRKLGCEELAPIFCTTDDICYGHMHRNLVWNRTKTLARGGDCCDFDLIVRDNGKQGPGTGCPPA